MLSARAEAPSNFSRISPSGSYLAARHAGGERDAAAAASYYRAALRGDPRNNELLGRTFLAVLANGEVEEAVKLAERVLQIDKTDRIARLVLGVRAIKQKQYPIARRELAQSIRGPITDLAATLLSAWTMASPTEVKAATDSIDKLAGPDWYAIFKDLHSAMILDLAATLLAAWTMASPTEVKAATDSIDKLAGPDWYAIFKDLHSAMILDLAGQKKDAAKRFERAYKLDPTALRVVQSYGSLLSRQGNTAEALKIFATFDEALPRHPLMLEATAELKAGKKLPMMIDTPQAGAAEVLYGLGAALGRRGGEDLGLVYLQLALYLAPSHPLALLSLGDLYEAMKKPELANKIYERVPLNSPLQRNAQIQLALNLDALDRTDEAKASLEKLIAANPGDLEAIMALGNVMRGRKQFAECGDVYSKGVETLTKSEKSNWVIYYFRGICFERSKQWAKAEADLKKALELFPDQAHVLNYLGYSWIDQGINLDDGMRMIKRAVEQRADDGYIVDSLGWAYYRIGNNEEAVKQLERAVELKPEDPTINDHLGDAYWKVGRVLEARFQWSHARDLKPEPEDLVKIEAKLKSGLPDDTSSAAEAEHKKPGGG
jgi:tetratricopeptide (TPR) repeat protein